MKETIVLYPAPSFAHLVSMVEFGKLILQHQPHLSIVILVPSMPSAHNSSSSSYISDLSLARIPISFLSLPSLQVTVYDSVAMNALNVLDALETLSSSFTILALVTSAPHQNLNTHIPIFCYFTSCASALAFFLYLPTFHSQTTKSFTDLRETLLDFPGLPSLSASNVPEPVLNRESPSYQFFLCFASSLLKSKGLIVNTFNFLEPRTVQAITDGDCVPNDQTPPIFCIGPLITSAKDHAIARSTSDYDEASDCMVWLDKQPSESVVFLCFGSKGVFSEAQIKEIAIGLERSRHRFLWVVKSPQGLNTEPKLDELLPHGFLERIKEKGLVVKSWAPQNAILRHESVGGFVTHCGWNSALEAVSYGVPMVAWPLYAEQHMNSVILVKEMKVAIAARDGSREGLVSSDEVERRVRQLMEMEEGKVMRCRILEMKAMAIKAWCSGGSSLNAFIDLVSSWKRG
ncbi:UDP-glycosyltransferase 88F5-like [Prosopis cineraria]|uniref:UDP-glycosyltransferase 88F5-like n=1 Tax=Prosopis cineraria TaxID=364024 RepID=UPI00240E9FD5|nr:UDP-glycosyltransferase 88F5-like [Prosopis cineraria]